MTEAGRKALWQGGGWCAGAALILWAVLACFRDSGLSVLSETPIPVVVAAGVAGFCVRWRVRDAALFVAAHVAAEVWGEPIVAPLLLACLSLGLLALSGRPRFSLLMGSGLLMLLLLASHLKRQFAGSVLTVQDVRYFVLQLQDNIGVMLSQPTVLLAAGATLVALVGAGVASWRWDGAAALATGQRQVMRHVGRVLAAAMAVGSGAALDRLAQQFSRSSAWQFSEIFVKQPVSTFLSTLHLDPTLHYQRVNTERFASEVKQLRSGASPGQPPSDIVVFLQESQFNPLAIRGCPQALCSLPLFQGGDDVQAQGELRVHVHGGGTWLSEFALATGVPHTLFGRAGDYASFNVAPGVQRSFVRSLKQAGYYTVALYPVRGGMMNARLAYQGYGFDEFIDSDQAGLPGSYDTPDRDIHEAAVGALERARQHGKPVFLMAVTIFNHSEHGRMFRVPPDVSDLASRIDGAQRERENLVDFVWRTREFARAYDDTRRAVLGSGRPTVLAWFGDHQPPFGSAPVLRSRIKAMAQPPRAPDRYLTWYQVSSNRPPAEARAEDRLLDIVFLPGLLAEQAGVKLDEWLAANVVARQRCQGLLQECPSEQWRNAYLSYLLQDLQAFR